MTILGESSPSALGSRARQDPLFCGVQTTDKKYQVVFTGLPGEHSVCLQATHCFVFFCVLCLVLDNECRTGTGLFNEQSLIIYELKISCEIGNALK